MNQLSEVTQPPRFDMALKSISGLNSETGEIIKAIRVRIGSILTFEPSPNTSERKPIGEAPSCHLNSLDYEIDRYRENFQQLLEINNQLARIAG